MKSFSNLQVFCEYIVRKYGGPDGASEEQKAHEFRSVYLKGFPLNLKTLRAAAMSCGIRVGGLEKMPENLRGYHEVFGAQKNIYFKKDDTLSGIENTILHEIREMMETTFAERCPAYEALRTSARHTAANQFAAAVLLPKANFIRKVYETGFDVIELAQIYEKSCSQVLLRVGEVLRGKLFFYAALYEPYGEGDTGWRVTYWTGNSNDDDSEANVYGLEGFFPRKGRDVMPGSLVEMTIRKGKPHIAEYITLLDDMEDDGLVAIARPLMIQECPAKVALVVLMVRNRDLLVAQVERINPLVVKGFHRHL